MMTFKQLEALFWIAELGGFSQAAARLHTTQSAVSKRVQELEALFENPLFDRSQRAARLTEKGEEMFQLARRLLEQRDQAVEQLRSPQVVERRLRLGVTELTAMTWLPRLVDLIEQNYPKVVIEADVDLSFNLHEKLLADEADIAILPNAFADTRFVSTPVGSVRNAWMCKPGLVDSARAIRLNELARHRLLVQGDRSGTGIVYTRWLKSIGIQSGATLTSNNLIAQIGMTISGLGISYLPLECLSPMAREGHLQALKVKPALPDVLYVALHKRQQHSTLFSSVVRFAAEACNFDRMFQAAGPVR